MLISITLIEIKPSTRVRRLQFGSISLHYFDHWSPTVALRGTITDSCDFAIRPVVPPLRFPGDRSLTALPAERAWHRPPFKFYDRTAPALCFSGIREWDQIIQSLMIPLVVVVLHILVDGLSQGAFSEENHPVEALLFQALDEAFGIAPTRVLFRKLDAELTDHFHLFLAIRLNLAFGRVFERHLLAVPV